MLTRTRISICILLYPFSSQIRTTQRWKGVYHLYCTNIYCSVAPVQCFHPGQHLYSSHLQLLPRQTVSEHWSKSQFPDSYAHSGIHGLQQSKEHVKVRAHVVKGYWSMCSCLSYRACHHPSVHFGLWLEDYIQLWIPGNGYDPHQVYGSGLPHRLGFYSTWYLP